MKRFKLINNVTGWLVFLVAAVTYCLTVEPSAPFWDCPEFTTTAVRLEVGHPPGAPFFMLMGNFFSHFTSDVTKLAYMVNIMSALMSALCILFLFWSVTHLVRRLIVDDNATSVNLSQLITIVASGVAAALAYAWSDTFWYSAVESEVYSSSSMFTALVFWLILKWEDHADEPHSDRWLVLIFYLTGLSIGVHLLNLLCLPAIVLVYYYKRYPDANLKGSLLALGLSVVLVAAVLYGVVPGIVKIGGWFELFCVNTCGMPFNTGVILYLMVLVGTVSTAIWATTKKNRALTNALFVASVGLLGIPFYGKGFVAPVMLGTVILSYLLLVLNAKKGQLLRVLLIHTGITVVFLLLGALLSLLYAKFAIIFFVCYFVFTLRYANMLMKEEGGEFYISSRLKNTALLCMLMLMIGYSSYAVIVIRSTQNTPMDQNSPEDIFTLGTYLGREQYGERPLLYGEAYTSIPDAAACQVEEHFDSHEHYEKEQKIQRHEPTPEERAAGVGDSYDVLELPVRPVYNSSMKMFFPRIYSSAHAKYYADWLGVSFPYDPEKEEDYDEWKKHFPSVDIVVDGDELSGDDYDLLVMPSQWDNVRFFFSYQVNFMYWRYFLWNFAGRQNDIQGHGEPEHGNWITGFSFIDDSLYGDQNLLPDDLKNNKGRNVFYCLPLLLGLLGLFWQAYRGKRGIQQFWVVFFLFFMTGLAIVLYLNQTPMQPRERDYAYAGSFYAFAMWIGFGVAAIADLPRIFSDKRKGGPSAKSSLCAACVAAVIAIAVPLQMVSQTWDDHDRSGRTACRDFGANYLYSLSEEGAPIIFTMGDNDTFPLWYNQDVEGVRTDARVCNLSYLQTDWYIDQMRRPAWNSPALPINWDRSEYVDNHDHETFAVAPGFIDLDALKEQLAADPALRKQYGGDDPYELRFIIDNFVRKGIKDDKGRMHHIVPTDSLVLTVDKDAVRKSGMMMPYGDSIPDKMHIDLSYRMTNSGQKDRRTYVSKSEMMVFEMLANANFKRPMYMSTTLGLENYANLEDYLVLEGLAYRITPFNVGMGAVDSDKMYKNMMTKFRYGGLDKDGLYLDETNMRMCYTHRSMFTYLIGALLDEAEVAETEAYKAEEAGDTAAKAKFEAEAKDKRDKALKALEYCKKVIPAKNVPYDVASLGLGRNLFNLPHYWHLVGRDAEAERILIAVGQRAQQYMNFVNSLSYERAARRNIEVLRNWNYLEMVYYGLEEIGSKQASNVEKAMIDLYNGNVGEIFSRAYGIDPSSLFGGYGDDDYGYGDDDYGYGDDDYGYGDDFDYSGYEDDVPAGAYTTDTDRVPAPYVNENSLQN